MHIGKSEQSILFLVKDVKIKFWRSFKLHFDFLNILKNRWLFHHCHSSYKALVKLYTTRQLSLPLYRECAVICCVSCMHCSWYCYVLCFFLIFTGPQARTQVSPTNKNLTPCTHSRGKHARLSSLCAMRALPGKHCLLDITVAPCIVSMTSRE